MKHSDVVHRIKTGHYRPLLPAQLAVQQRLDALPETSLFAERLQRELETKLNLNAVCNGRAVEAMHRNCHPRKKPKRIKRSPL